MKITDPLYTASMNDHQRAWFYAEYEQARKEESVGVLLALFLGFIGIHRFYLRQNTAGILYLVFSWTGIPAILGFIECFLMPERVRAYNAAQATFIAGQILAQSGGPSPAEPGAYPAAAAIPTTQPCVNCGQPLDTTAIFCPHCGISRSTTNAS